MKLFNEMHKRNPDFFSIGGYDGMHVIYEALKKTGGKTDGDSLIAAAKGMKWDSPRGPMSIDPETRDVVQTIYIRKVEKVNGEPQNVAFDKVENVKDPVKARHAEVAAIRRSPTARIAAHARPLQFAAGRGINDVNEAIESIAFGGTHATRNDRACLLRRHAARGDIRPRPGHRQDRRDHVLFGPVRRSAAPRSTTASSST